jgi:hypothetical protein
MKTDARKMEPEELDDGDKLSQGITSCLDTMDRQDDLTPADVDWAGF